MSTRWTLCGILLASAIGPGACLAEPVSCPDSLAVSESTSSTPPGWRVIPDAVPHSLAGVTFFDGDPADQASIVPQRDVRHGHGSVATWRFGKNATLVWLACRYLDTGLSLAKELPKYRECLVHYRAGDIVEGIDCQ